MNALQGVTRLERLELCDGLCSRLTTIMINDVALLHYEAMLAESPVANFVVVFK